MSCISVKGEYSNSSTAEITAAAEAVRTIRALRPSSPYRADQIGEQP